MNKVVIPKAIRSKWLKALRSGKYKRGTGQLMKTHSGEQRYCCLGVLEHCITGQVKKPELGFLSDSFLEKYNLKNLEDNSYINRYGDRIKYQEYLSVINDTGKKGFDYIADRIEKTTIGE